MEKEILFADDDWLIMYWVCRIDGYEDICLN